MNCSLPGQPANDDFINRIVISGELVAVTGNNVGATLEKGEPLSTESPFGDPMGGNTVWWTWTASFTGQVEANTADSQFDTILGVYSGNQLLELMKPIFSVKTVFSSG